MIELIVGGARSGKSGYALQVANESQLTRHFIATAQLIEGMPDAEMNSRIRRHKEERDAGWALVEEPKNLAALVHRFTLRDIVLVDCLTLWLSNWLCFDELENWGQEKKAFLSAVQGSPAHWLLVSNETGLGITPDNALGRQFVDQAGWLHQEIAAVAQRVTMVSMGIPQHIKDIKA